MNFEHVLTMVGTQIRMGPGGAVRIGDRASPTSPR